MIGSAGLRIVGMGFGFLVGVQLARGLGPAGYGVYGIAMAAIAIFMLPTELGLPQLVMREVSSALALDGVGATIAIVKWARRLVILSSLAIASGVLCVLATGLFEITPGVRSTLMVGLLWIPIVAIGNIYGAALRGMHHVVSGQVGEILLRPALISLTLFVLVNQGAWHLDPTSAMGVNVLGAFAAAGLSVFLLGRTGTTVPSDVFPRTPKFSHALPMAMSEGMRVLGGQVGMLVLAVMASKKDAGLYRVAYGIYTVTTMPSALINVACAPTISNLFAKGKIRRLARLNIWISIFLTTAAAAFLLLSYLFGRETISALFGREYAHSAEVLLVFMAGELVAGIFGYPAVVLNMMRQQKVVMWWSVGALIANFLVAVALVRIIGYMGAAFGSVAGLVLWRAGCSAFSKLRLGMDTGLITKLIPVRARLSAPKGFDDD